MTTFKLPDFESNGGNRLSKFIASYEFALPGKIARPLRKVSVVTNCDGWCVDRPKIKAALECEAGATGYILLWLLGIPIPILLIIFLLRGCT